MDIDRATLAKYIDHTLLKPDATAAEIERLCEEAKTYGFAAVCVNSGRVGVCSRHLHGSGVKVCAVVGFPLGAMLAEAKADETRRAVAAGADEIDMVIGIGALKDGQDDLVQEDIRRVVSAAYGRLVKVIIETCLLTDEEKERACRLAVRAGAAFVKTSTGFSKGGATLADVALMRCVVGPDIGVKAAGGIRDYATAVAMIEAGATRLGCSAGIAIVNGASSSGGGY
jgi:deoxyribose-phosphate aldolase